MRTPRSRTPAGVRERGAHRLSQTRLTGADPDAWSSSQGALDPNLRRPAAREARDDETDRSPGLDVPDDRGGRLADRPVRQRFPDGGDAYDAMEGRVQRRMSREPGGELRVDVEERRGAGSDVMGRDQAPAEERAVGMKQRIRGAPEEAPHQRLGDPGDAGEAQKGGAERGRKIEGDAGLQQIEFG
jgi:hypothetical protein